MTEIDIAALDEVDGGELFCLEGVVDLVDEEV